MKRIWNKPVFSNLDVTMTLGGEPGASNESSIQGYGSTIGGVVLDRAYTESELKNLIKGQEHKSLREQVLAFSSSFLTASKS